MVSIRRAWPMFNDYLERWSLTPDGAPIVTATSKLLPVRMDGLPAMLKIAVIDEEKRGGLLMIWWEGRGAAPILAHNDDALLMERAQDGISLAELTHGNRDDEASRIICSVLDRLHASRNRPLPELVPLTKWFEALYPAAEALGGILRVSAAVASNLLTTERETAVLHGDMHHGNVLNFGSRGWLAIDPKGLIGERYFDYANTLCNPDEETAIAPGRLARQANVIAESARLDRNRLLEWVVAWAGLSAAFLLEDGLPLEAALKFTELAAAQLSG
jgi:streptomycin 6-kinase